MTKGADIIAAIILLAHTIATGIFGVFFAKEIRFSGTIAFNLLSIVDIFPSILG